MFFKKYYKPILVTILAFSFFTRIVRLHVPERYVFDEVYHALTAKLIAANDPRAYEWWNPPIEKDTAVDWLHPPLAKYTQAIGMKLFGENSFGWRISSVIFGVLVIAATAKLAFVVFKDEKVALLAAGLASLDGLLLVQSRIAMNDIHLTFFILMALLMYAQKKKWWTSLFIGLAMGTKWSGVFLIPLIWLFELVAIYLHFKQKIFKTFIASIFLFLLIPGIVYILSYSHMFWQGKSLVCFQQKHIQGKCYLEKVRLPSWEDLWYGDDYISFYGSHFYELHRQIISYQTGLQATHDYQSRPWQWFLDLRPVWIHVAYIDQNTIANIYSFGNPALFWIGNISIFATLVTLIAWKLKKTFLKKNELQKLGFVVIAYGAVWLPWQFSPRIMFFYHYTPAVPLLSIILAFWLVKLYEQVPRYGKYLVLVVLFAIAACFAVWYPHWTAIPVPKDFAQRIYFAIKTWK